MVLDGELIVVPEYYKQSKAKQNNQYSQIGVTVATFIAMISLQISTVSGSRVTKTKRLAS